MSPGSAGAATGSADAGELGRLAEIAARFGDTRRADPVERRIAAALAALRERGDTGDAATDRLLAAAADTARPLSRRVAVLAHLHRMLVARAGP